MNTSQIVNLVLKCLVFLGGIAAAHGLGKYVTFLNDQETLGVITLGVTLIVSHIMHTGSGPGPSAAAVVAARPSSPNSALIALLCLVGSMGLGTILCSCSSTPLKVAYTAETVTDSTITTAMQVWGDWVAANHPSAATEQAVRTAFEKVKAAELLANSATQIYLQSGDTNLVAAITADGQTVTQAYQDLVTLLQSLGVKL